MAKRLVLSIILAAAAVALVAPVQAQSRARTLTATLTAEQEAPGPGDPDATGTATILLRPGHRLVCFELSWSNVGDGEDTVTAAHIHQAPAGEPGPVRVALFTGESFEENDSASGCVTASSRQIASIIANPERYYVNVHSEDYPGGAIRGQLHR